MHFQDDLVELLEALVPPMGPFALDPLTGDASSRRYYRIRSRRDANRTLMLMVLASPALAASEEGSSGLVPDELTFANIQRYMASIGLPVPAIHAYDQPHGLLLLEDFGDLTLEAWLHGRSDGEILAMYTRAVDLLVDMQVKGTKQMNSSCWASREAFDERLLRWEFEHFYEYGVVARYGEPDPSDFDVIKRYFDEMSHRLAGLPRVLVHRDYHSRNLMIHGDGIGLIDFQDALMGPRHYDLASLLKDSYVTLPDAQIDALIAHYLEAYKAAGGELTVDADPAVFRANFDLMSIQRNLKAAGRFDYINIVKGNPKFLQYIPRTLENVRRNLSRYEWLSPLQEALGRKVPALRAS